MSPLKKRKKSVTFDLPKTENSHSTQLRSKSITNLKNITPNDDDSSSESDIENYLQPINKIDLNSLLHDARKIKSLVEINENNASVDSNNEEAIIPSTPSLNSLRSYSKMKPENRTSNLFDAEETEIPSTLKSSFRHLHEYTDYTKKMEEARKYVENYNARKAVETESHNTVYNLLATVEGKSEIQEKNPSDSLSNNSSDFESCSDSDNDNWEEVEEPKDKSLIPEKDMQITVQMPGHGHTKKKKKKEDIFASIIRRINNIRKKNQILVHKVHLLCWIGHGNHLNSVINSNKILAVALSLLPPDLLRRPSKRTDLSRLEELLEWFKGAIPHVEKAIPDTISLENILLLQMNKSEAWNKKMLVYLFITILRSLGIQCRLALSFQVEPVRPPDSELCSLSTKNRKNKSENARTVKRTDERKKEEKGTDRNNKNKKTSSVKRASRGSETDHTESESVSESSESDDDREESKPRTYSLRSQTKILQLDGVNDSTSDDEVFAQLAAKSKKKRKSVPERTHTRFKIKLKSLQNSDSEDDFVVRSPFASKNKDSPLILRIKSQTELKTSNSSPKTSYKNRNNDSNKIGTHTKKEIEPKEEDNKLSSPTTRSKTKIRRNEENEEKYCPKNRASARRRTKSEVELPKRTKKSNSDSEDDFDVRNPFTNQNKDSPSFILRTKSQTDLKTSNSSPATSLKSRNNNNKIGTHKKKVVEPEVADNNPPSLVTRSKARIKRSEANEEKPCPINRASAKKRTKSETELTKRIKIDKACTPTSNEEKSLPKNRATAKKRTNSEIELPKTKITKKSPSSSPKIDKTASTSKLLPDSKKIATCATKTSKKKVEPPVASMKNASKLEKDNANVTKSKKRRTSEDDFDSSTVCTTRKLPAMKKNIKRKKTVSPKKLKESVDVWTEVYLEAEARWVCVDVTRGEIDCVDQLYARATQPVLYTVAWDNDGSLKDISSKYCENFNTTTRRLRIDQKWWGATLEPFKGKKTARDKLEDEELEKKQLNQPIPKTIKEYKNHPLYVLKRHLLKYEAIYPPEAPSLGFCRNEPVYSRQCVFTLHPRFLWLKQAKVVKPGEKAYKIVKGRPRWDKLSHSIVTDPEEEVFGPWQVQDYEPPTAENGVVPRNEYGNVELFKPCMLPKKTVHLRLPGLPKIAKRMNIDCAPAFTGFDFSDGWIHPAYDGFVVCEEFEDVLVAAWELEQEEIEKREQEKIDKRVYANWKLLIKGLLIREKLKAKYAFGDTSSSMTKKRAKGPPKFSTKKRKM